MRRGAHGPLATLRPTEGPPIWTTIFTGRLPRDHGVKSFATYRLRGSPHGVRAAAQGRAGRPARAGRASSRRPPSPPPRAGGRALWDALNAFGIRAGHRARSGAPIPPERVQGFMLSPYFHLLQRRSGARARRRSTRATCSRRSGPAAGGRARRGPRAALASSSTCSVELPRRPRALAPRAGRARAGARPHLPARRRRAARRLRSAVLRHLLPRPRRGRAHASRASRIPSRFGDVGAEEARRYGGVVRRATPTLLSRRRGRGGAGPAARGGPARGLGLRHGAGAALAARLAGALDGEPWRQRHARGRARRRPAGRGRRHPAGRRPAAARPCSTSRRRSST